MPRGYRLYLTAFAGLALSYPIEHRAYAQTGASERNEGAQAEAQPSSLIAIENSLNRISSEMEASRREPQTESAHAQGERDLAAQEGMWRWAMFATIVAAIMALLTFVGLVLIGQTLSHTRRAADYAGNMAEDAKASTKAATKAAKEASASNEIARKSQLAQLRPYMHMTKAEAEFHHMLGMELVGDPVEFKVWVKNFGQTPAKDVRMTAEWALVRVEGWRDESKSELQAVILGDMPPQFEGAGIFHATGVKKIHTLVLGGTFTIEFRARIDYSDGFGRSYSSDVRRYCTGSDYGRGVLFLSDKGNRSD